MFFVFIYLFLKLLL